VSKRVARIARVAAAQGALAVAGIALLELVARVTTGGPHGTFRGWFPGRAGLYPERAELRVPGAVDWTVRTNGRGMRGPEIAEQRTPGVARVAMVGDSVTDGFGVDDAHTYPAQVEAGLRAAGLRAEVINAARGGGSISRELAILREAVTPLRPDVVVLTFVTNDVHGLGELDDAHLLEARLAEHGLRLALTRALLCETALGERAFDAWLRFGSATWAARPAGSAVVPDRERHAIAGGRDFAANVRRFLDVHREADAQLLVDPLPAAVERQLARYLRAWDAFVAHARRHGMQPVLAYFPSYAEVYDETLPTPVRRLQAHAEAAAVPFLDLTPALRSRGDAVLHLAPLDFHPNPEGNRVIGAALAGFLVERGLVPAP
jgi:lysophospholipase L1-like esterase